VSTEPKHVGDGQRLSFALDVGTTPTDPTALTLTLTPPNAAATVLNWPTPLEITRDSAGRFHYDLTLTAPGPWRFDWNATGAATGSDEGFIYALPAITADAPPILAGIEDIKISRRDATDGATDELISQLLVRASAAVMDFTGGRRFLPLITTADRFFQITTNAYEELWIDDLSTAPTEVELLDIYGTSLQTLVSGEYVMLPRNRNSWEPFEAIRIRPTVSLANGYELRVKGLWGWPITPSPVREAVIEIVVGWLKDGAGLTVPSPDPFETGAPRPIAIPGKARKLLAAYDRTMVVA